MKKLTIRLITLLAMAGSVFAQGTLWFANSGTSRVTFQETGARVPGSNGIHVIVYVAPDGQTNEAVFVPATSSLLVGVTGGLPNPGLYESPVLQPVAIAAPGSVVMVQVRAFEIAYGANYEQAVAAPPMNGRRTYAGKSVVARYTLGGGILGGPAKVGDVVGPMTVSVVHSNPFFAINNIVLAEGTNGVVQAVFTVTRFGDSNGTATVDFATANGTALAGSDYVATNGTLSFGNGETTKSIAVDVTADAAQEPDEVFYVNLSNAVNAEVGNAQGSCLVTEVRVTGLRVDTVVSFNTVLNHSYAVEKSSDSITWTVVSGAANVPGTGGIVSIVDAGSGCQAVMLYRARLLTP